MQQGENMLTLASFELGDLGEVEHGESCLESARVVHRFGDESYLIFILLGC